MPFPAKYNDIVKDLIDTNPDFKSMIEEHRSIDSEVTELEKRLSLSPEDELELSRLKKEKLFLRDKMNAIIESQ